MNNIKELRLNKHLTQRQLADMLGIEQSAVSKWEQDACLPTAETVIKLAEIFNVSTDYVLGFSRYHFPTNVGNDNYFNFEELEIIEDYRSLSPDLQKVIKQTLKTFKGNN